MFLIQNVVKKIVALSLVLTMAFSVGLSNASAASQCKGLAKTKCSSQANCSWVSAYTRSDGAKVKAFCRSSAKGKSSKSKASTTKSKAAAKSKATTKSKTAAKSKATKSKAAAKTTKAKTATKKTKTKTKAKAKTKAK